MAFEWIGNRHSRGTRYRITADGEVWFYLGDDGTGMYPAGWAEAIMDEDVICEGLLSALGALEVYRKALAPFARLFADGQHNWIEACPDDEERAALSEACRLMGIDIPETRGED